MLLPDVDRAPLQGPFAFRPGFVLTDGSLILPTPELLPAPALPVPMPVVPGVVVLPGADRPDVPPVAEPPTELPVEAPPVAPPAAPPPAPPPDPPPPPPPPAAKAAPLDNASVAARIAVVIFISSSFPNDKRQEAKQRGSSMFLTSKQW